MPDSSFITTLASHIIKVLLWRLYPGIAFLIRKQYHTGIGPRHPPPLFSSETLLILRVVFKYKIIFYY
ncbi:hypothetical protein EYC80_006901 [Monilinia laxa]|uniref:Uncharacterized protein n=1 Tax=Monilinia laxa TaxID=61186 RepID=A0A5N6JZK3_MONLA|nr:hypothetical protein EYC80_006901 [Monilinia laxa]